jgi:hypothetical protein
VASATFSTWTKHPACRTAARIKIADRLMRPP